MVRNWRTSLSGLIVAAAGFVLFSPDTFAHYPIVVQIAKYIGVGGLAAMGLTGKDAATHSTAAEVQASTAAAKPEGSA